MELVFLVAIYLLILPFVLPFNIKRSYDNAYLGKEKWDWFSRTFLSKKVDLEDRERQVYLRRAIFWGVIGIFLGVIAPIYLKTNDWVTIVFRLVGIVLFICVTLSSILIAWTHKFGVGLTYIVMAGTIQYIIKTYSLDISNSFILFLRIVVILSFAVATFQLMSRVIINLQSKDNDVDNYSPKIYFSIKYIGITLLAFMSALITIRDFINLIGDWLQ